MHVSAVSPRFARPQAPRLSYPYSGALYQLYSAQQLRTGAYVGVNGLHDRFGMVLRSLPTEDGRWLNLIRGIKERTGERIVANF
jgi:hypothetical protein